MSLYCPKCGSRDVVEYVSMEAWVIGYNHGLLHQQPEILDRGPITGVIEHICQTCGLRAPGDEDWSRSPAQIRADEEADHADMMNKEAKMRMRHATNKLDEIYRRLGGS